MEEKIKKIIEQISFFTVTPDRDWKKMCIILGFLALCSFGWNVYFYFTVQADIKAAEIGGATKNLSIGAREDEIQEIISVYEKEKTEQMELILQKNLKLEDPSIL